MKPPSAEEVKKEINDELLRVLEADQNISGLDATTKIAQLKDIVKIALDTKNQGFLPMIDVAAVKQILKTPEAAMQLQYAIFDLINLINEVPKRGMGN